MSDPSASPQNFSDKIFVVTGASRGIGKALSIQLGQAGAQVIAIARTIGGLEEIDDAIQNSGGKPLLLVPLDLTDLKSLSTLGTQLAARFERIDGVFGLAALLTKLGPLMHSPLLHLQQSLHLNVLANATLLQTLHPLLLNAPAPQIVYLMHPIEREPKAFWGAYAASQSALRTLLNVYAQENAGIKTSLLEPPATDTWLFREAFPGYPGPLNTPEETAAWVLEQL